MDFTLSLTHFCETHGPKNVLCTQILRNECAICLPPTPPLRARSSGDTLDVQDEHDEYHARRQHTVPSLRKTGTDLTLPTDFSGASTTIDSEPESPNIERHPLFKHNDTDISPQFRYGRAQGETCASCSFSAPEAVADRLPFGAPGSIKSDGKSKNGAPVFRSREIVCLGASPPTSTSNLDGAASTGSVATSFPGSSSYNSSTQSTHPQHNPESCHDHTLTYLTAKSPSDPTTYAALRASVIRTLSCEMLPRGMADGPLCFGDSIGGYTIAYVFRLTDPKARGRRRCYAFLALAGRDASRAFRACPMLWERFAAMAKKIEALATRAVEEKERREEAERAGKAESNNNTSTRPVSGSAFGARTGAGGSGGGGKEKVAYTPVSSFLTQRAMDPDGTMRRAGQTSPRSLADIVGDETIFAILHKYFVALLRCLGDRFGGLPISAESVFQTTADAGGLEDAKTPARVHQERVDSSPTKSRMSATAAAVDSIGASPQKPAHDRTTTPKLHGRDLSARTKPAHDQIIHAPPMGRKERNPQHHHQTSISSTTTTISDDIERAKRRLSKTLSLGGSGQCAPLQITQAEVRGQVGVVGPAAAGGGVAGGGERRSVVA